MRTIIVKIESADSINITAKAIEDKWNFNLLEENKIKVSIINEELNWISVLDKLPEDVQKNVKVKMPNGRETEMYGSYLNYIIKNKGATDVSLTPTHWRF